MISKKARLFNNSLAGKIMVMINVKIMLSLLCMGLGGVCSGQQLYYTAAEAQAIRDSIASSRWDIGGRLSHYSFRHMSEFFPVGIIKKPEVSFPFSSEPLQSVTNLQVAIENDTISFSAYLKSLHINGFIAVRKGVIVYENYLGMLPDEQHTIQSINKVVTSTLITQLINDKKIEVLQPIEKYLPALSGSDWQGITVKDILNMRSGMEGSEMDLASGPFHNPANPHYKFEEALDILPETEGRPAAVFQFVASLKKIQPAGQQAEYNSVNTFILGWLAETVTGKKYVDLVSENLWKPMGASSEAYICLSGEGIPWTHGGMSVTLRDLARFGMLFTHSAIQRNNENRISMAQLQEIFDTETLNPPMPPFQWGYQWDMAANGILLKSGFGGQALYIHPEKEIVIAYFNYIDKDWGMNRMLSEEALMTLLKAIETKQ